MLNIYDKYRQDKKNFIDKLINLLKSINDPELSISIYELGLIYDIQINQYFNIKIIMTLTTPNCPVADHFVNEVKQKIHTLYNIKNIYIILTFDPIWTYDKLNEELRFKLEFL